MTSSSPSAPLEPLSQPVHIVSLLRTGAPLKFNFSRHEAAPDEDLQDQRLQPHEGYKDRTYRFEDFAQDEHEGALIAKYPAAEETLSS